MSLLINDDLIWLSIPKCASNSFEKALFKTNLNIKKINAQNDLEKRNIYDLHMHMRLNNLYDEFGYKESICITRDWFDRWIGSLYEIWRLIKEYGYEPICEFENIDNDFIYNTFTNSFADDAYSGLHEKCAGKLIKNYHTPHFAITNMSMVLLSQNWWKGNKKCTYEFDINELNKLEDFIYNRYGEKISISKINSNKDKKNKIIVNDELKNWIWNHYERRFHKPITLI